MDEAYGGRAPRRGTFPLDALRALAIVAALGVPTSLLAFAMHKEVGALAAPVLGPWAGWAIGHHDCTMAAVFPDRSLGLVLAGVVVAVGLAVARPAVRGLLLVALGAWTLLWCGAALMSMLNAAS